MKRLGMFRQATIAVAAILLPAALHGRIPPTALYVANNGTDSAICGEDHSPCRSIRQAIANASPGDRIIVGPGRYGDLNGNGVFGEPGEEGGATAWNCMILVDKPVTLISRDGASATVLDATGAPNTAVVRILANDVVFGGFKHGFTLRGGINSLVVQGVSRVVVHGNRATDSGRDGFLIYGSGNKLRDNQAFGNVQVGFFVTGQGHEVAGNEAVSNGGPGFWILQSRHIVRRNVALDNGSNGFLVSGEGHTFRRNVAVGNRGAGIMASSAGLTFRQNNVYGNYGGPSPDLLNCGFVNNTAGTIKATENFWGAETGPGGDPADDVCETAGGRTVVNPYAPFEFGTPADPQNLSASAVWVNGPAGRAEPR